MATISGSLDYVSTRPAAVSEVLVRAPDSRTRGTGVITTGHDRFPVVDGVVTFTAFAGPAVLSLVCDGRLSESLPIFVGEADQQTLKQVVDAAGLLDDASQSELEALAQQVLGDAESVAVAAGRAVAAAESAATSAESAQTSADMAESAADRTGDAALRAEAAAEVAGEAAQSAGEDANAADAAAGRAASAAESAGQAAGRAETAAGVAGDAVSRAESAAEVADAAASEAAVTAVAAKVNELTRDAPEAFDTLAEIAAELEQNESDRAVLTQQLASKASVEHTHVMGDVEGLGDALAGKAPTSHTHSTDQISGLDSALAGKAAASHTHTTGEITGLDSALAAIPKIQVVDAVPESPDAETLYLVKEA